MSQRLQQLSPPALPALRWLTDAGPGVPSHVREVLIAELFSTPLNVLMAVICSGMVTAVALMLNYDSAFVVLLALDVACAAARIAIIRAAHNPAARHRRMSTDLYVVLLVVWCAVQGMIAFTAMRSDCRPLQILAATTIMGMIGPICARSYPAPRLGLLLVCLCDLPFVAGSLLSGVTWLIVLAIQAPMHLFGGACIINHFKTLAIATLKAEQENKHRAHHDPLTGLRNRLGLADILDHFGPSDLAKLCTLCLDLDGFKQVNDTLGHHVGDALLQAAARRFEAHMRPGDVIVRMGGDEFIILAQDVTPSQAKDCAERLIEQVTAEPFLLDGIHLVRLSTSIGFACAPEDGTDFESLHRKADAALYAAKAAGKGVARRFEPEFRGNGPHSPCLSGMMSSATGPAR